MNQPQHMTNGEMVKGGVGSLVTLALAALSLANIEIILRLASLSVGLSIGLATLIGMYRKNRNRRKHKHHEK